MQSMFLFHKILILLFGVAISVQAVPPVLNYAGQVAVNGEAFDGNGLFKFALVNADGTTTYWSNDGTSVDGSEPLASVAVSVNGGLYAILLGNTALRPTGVS
jgi:ABC-type branched-subunit amino acid transport system permease subunit